MAGRSLIAVVTPAFGCAESVDALVHEVDGGGAEVRLIAPAVAANSIEGAFGEIDEPRVEARERLRLALSSAGHPSFSTFSSTPSRRSSSFRGSCFHIRTR